MSMDLDMFERNRLKYEQAQRGYDAQAPNGWNSTLSTEEEILEIADGLLTDAEKLDVARELIKQVTQAHSVRCIEVNYDNAYPQAWKICVYGTKAELARTGRKAMQYIRKRDVLFRRFVTPNMKKERKET